MSHHCLPFLIFFVFYLFFLTLLATRHILQFAIFDFIVTSIRFHHNVPYRMFSLNCKLYFKTKKETRRKNCFKKHLISIFYHIPILGGLLVGAGSQIAFVGIFQNFVGVELTFSLKS